MYLFMAVLSLCCYMQALQLQRAGGYSPWWCSGFPLQWLFLSPEPGSKHAGFRSCCAWAQQLCLVDPRAWIQKLWCRSSVAKQHVVSSWSRGQTHVSCIGRWTLNHWRHQASPERRILKYRIRHSLNYMTEYFDQLQ